MSSEESCLVHKLSKYIDLNETDKELLKALEQDPRAYESGSTVIREGSDWTQLFVVQDGWLYSSTLVADGKRQVLRIHYPGDVVGLPQLPFDRAMHSLVAATDARLCPFPKRKLDAILRSAPRLTALFFTIAIIEQAVLSDRLRAVARTSATDRLAHFLLEIRSRLRLTGDPDATRFPLPVNQSVIGDALGLTNASVSRATAELEQEGLLKRSRGEFELAVDELVARVEFHDRFTEINTEWFPGAA